MKTFFQREDVRHSICIVLFGLSLAYYFFGIRNCLAYPWFDRSNGSEADGFYAAQTIGMLNGERNRWVQHPGATVSMLSGPVYRALALFSESHRKFFRLDEVTSMDDVFSMLNTAVRTSRTISLLLSLACSLLLYGLIYLLTNDWLLSMFSAGYVTFSEALLQYTVQVRPDLLSEFFLLCAVFLGFFWLRRKPSRPFWSSPMFLFGGIGFLLGLAIFSKVQIGPALPIFLVVVFWYVSDPDGRGRDLARGERTTSWRKIAYINLIAMPWWALTKPAFLTPAYLQSYGISYGPAPDSFIPDILLLLLGVWGLSWLLERFVSRSWMCLLAIHSMILGLILSTYLVLLSTSGNIKSYIINTRHLVYSVMTNLRYATGLENSGISYAEAIQKLLGMHAGQSPFLTVNLLYIVAFAAWACVGRLFFQSSPEAKKSYLLCLAFLATGHIMDLFSCMRGKDLYIQYAMYSVCFFGVGLALWLSTEFKHHKTGVIRPVIIGLMALQLFLVGKNLAKRPRESGISANDARVMYHDLRHYVLPFAERVETSIGQYPTVIK